MRLLGLGLVGLVLGIPAGATTSYYTSESAFYTAAGLQGLTMTPAAHPPLIDFTASNGFSGTVLADAIGTTVDFAGFNQSNVAANLSVSGGALISPTFGAITATTDANGQAVGFYFAPTSGSRILCVIATGPSCETQAFVTAGTPAFFGAVSTTAGVISLTVRDSGNNSTVTITSFATGSAPLQSGGDVPEPGTMVLIGTGLLTVPWMKWRLGLHRARR